MNWQDRVIAGFLVFQAVLSAATLVWLAGQLPWSTLASIGPLSLLALVAGIASFKRRRWARIAGVAVFLAQIVSVSTPSFFFALWLGVQFNVRLGWFDAGEIGVNLLALGFCVWAAVRLVANERAA